MTSCGLLAILASALWAGPEGLAPRSGQWSETREVIKMIRQGTETGTAVALCPEAKAATGAWRVTVEPALGAAQAGLWALADEGLTRGFLVTLGGQGKGSEGLRLQRADGTVLWQDRRAPWHWYQPYVLEAVVEPGRIRAQVLEADGKTLVSQGPWVEVAEGETSGGTLGLYTRDSIARFWDWTAGGEALSPVVDNAPNKLRIIQDDSDPWCVIGSGDWLWTGLDRQRFRQRLVVERSSLLGTEPRGPEGTWESLITVHQGAGGAGLLFLVDRGIGSGFNAWLGGEFGNGALMLYRNPGDALWSGPQGAWHYDTEYLVRGEVTDGKVRAQMLTPDGLRVIQESPWVPLTPQERERPGLVGNMTWLGTAEFASADAGAGGATGATPAGATTLVNGWTLRGDGAWDEPQPGTLRQASKATKAVALSSSVQGISGHWVCEVESGEGTTAGLAFQMDGDLGKGFLALVGPDGFRLEDATGRVMWRDAAARPAGRVQVEGEVMTDRVAVRFRAADGTLLAESPAVYVPETNNHRRGSLGLVTMGGAASFSNWGLR